jgi:hypothetical protein
MVLRGGWNKSWACAVHYWLLALTCGLCNQALATSVFGRLNQWLVLYNDGETN